MLLAVLLALAAAGCAPHRGAPPGGAAPPETSGGVGPAHRAAQRPPAREAETLDHYLHGLALQGEGRTGEAIRELETALAEGGTDLGIHLALAECHLAAGDPAAAERAARAGLAAPRGGSAAVLRDAHRLMAGLRLMAGDPLAAMGELEEARRADPRHFEVLWQLGSLSRQLGQDSVAALRLREAAAVAPGDVRLRLDLAREIEETGDAAGAGEEYARLRAEAQHQDARIYGQALRGLARLAERAGDLPEAIGLLEEARALEEDPQLLGELLRLRLRSGDWQGAVEVGRQLLAAQPADVETAVQVVGALIESGRMTEAQEVLAGLGEAGEGSPAVHLQRGRLLCMGGDLKGGAAELERAAALAPGAPAPLASLGYVLLQLGRAERADSVLAAARELDPDNAEVCFLLGVAHRETGRLEESRVLLSRALELRPGDERTLFELGVLLERTDRTDEAAEVFGRLLEVNPSNAVARNYLGFMLADRGIRLQESLKHLEIAVAQEPDNGYFLDSLGWVHYRLGELGRATELLERAATLADIAPIRAHLAEVYERQGMISQARDNWRRALELDPDHPEWGRRLEALRGD